MMSTLFRTRVYLRQMLQIPSPEDLRSKEQPSLVTHNGYTVLSM